MLEVIDWATLSALEKIKKLSRPIYNSTTRVQVSQIIEMVKAQGDDALYELTKRYDGVDLKRLKLTQSEIDSASVTPQIFNALQQAINTITKYHRSQLPESQCIETAEGITIQTVYRPIPRVGFYVPGGNQTPLISSLLMQAIPAQVAGCPIKVLCTPPDAQGCISPMLLVAARLCGIDTIYPLGGAQAIAAMSYGTQTISKVDKLYGPGNSYVTEAKTQVANDGEGAAIDLPAGPSEVMIVADSSANPAFIAADLLAQAEHGIDSQVILICDTLVTAQQVNEQLKRQFSGLSRQEIMQQALSKSLIIICSNRQEQINIINNYAPEHLIMNCNNASSWVDSIKACGTVFLGSWSAETMGDYVSGSNHVLPTNGFAKNHSGLSTLDFLNRFTVQTISSKGIQTLGPAAIILAQAEGLDAHANAVSIRLNDLEL